MNFFIGVHGSSSTSYVCKAQNTVVVPPYKILRTKCSSGCGGRWKGTEKSPFSFLYFARGVVRLFNGCF